jgi:uncharacterized protein YjlB
MVKTITVTENKPYPNNELPILYYEDALNNELDDDYSPEDVLELFENNGYNHGWIGVINDRHHFHSNAHEALACTRGEVTVQFGGQNGEITTLRKGDVVLLPAGTAHKRLDGSNDFQIVGAYPSNGQNFDMQYGDASDYEQIKENISNVGRPLTDPVTGDPGDMEEYWT